MIKVTDLINAENVGLLGRFGRPGFQDIVLQSEDNDKQDIRHFIQQ